MERGQKLSKAPVAYALVHVKFSPILSLANHVPAIQEKLRTEYPRYAVGQLAQFRIGVDGRPEMGVAEQQWDFNSKNNDSGIRLTTGSFIYHCTKYSTFEDFLKAAASALTIVNEAAGITLVERIGVRYIDLVVPENDKSVADYLIPSLTGFRDLNGGGNDFLVSVNQTNLKTSTGTLTVRCVVGNHMTVLPPDLAGCNLITKQPPAEKQTALLDTDHFTDSALDFSVEQVANRINALHKPISEAFWSSITPFAKESWK